MKVTIYGRVPGAKRAGLVPPAYREDVAAATATRPDGEYSLLLFAHAPRGALAVGIVFTEEALALLAEAGARPVAFGRHARQL